MRFATVTLLVMASTATSVALAQDGGGSGPPKKASIVLAAHAPAVRAPLSMRQLFQPATELRTMTK